MSDFRSPSGVGGILKNQHASTNARVRQRGSTKRTPAVALASAAAAGLIGLLGATHSTHAATTGTWIAGSGNWAGTPANWQGGFIPGSAGDIANFTTPLNNVAATVTLNANESVGALTLGSTNGGAYVIASPGILTFDSGTPGVAATLNTTPLTSSSNTISAPVTLDSNLLISNSDLISKQLTLSGSIAGNGGSPGDPTNADNAINIYGVGSFGGVGSEQITLSGSISNVTAIRNLFGDCDAQGNGSSNYTVTVSGNISNGSTALELSSYGDSTLRVSGVITTTGGLTINGPGGLGGMSPNAFAGQVSVAGANAITGGTTVNAGWLYLDYTATGGNSNKIDPASALTLNSSYLTLNGTSGSSSSVQNVSGLVAGGGASEVTIAGLTTFNIGSGLITRTNNATLDFHNSAATSTIANTSTGIVNGILPAWITWGGTDWATVSAGHIIQLPSASYTTITGSQTLADTNNDLLATSNANLTIANPSSTNSLKDTSNAQVSAITLGNNLTLLSGGFLTNAFDGNGTSPAALINVNSSGGSLIAGSTGTGELLLQTENNISLLQFNAPIVAGSLTKSGAGEVLLNNSTVPTGQVTINQGTLALSSSVTLSSNLTGSIALNSGGALGLSGIFNYNFGAIGTAGTVNFGAGGGGLAAVGGPLTVNFNGSGQTITSSQVGGTLVLNNMAATAPIILVNPININTVGLTISVAGSGSLSGQGSTSGNIFATNLGNNGYAYSQVGAISGSGDLHVLGSPNGATADAPSGLLVPTGPLTYTGMTVLTGAALYASPNAASLPSTTRLELSSMGVLATSGTFNWSVGGAVGQVTLGMYGGFAAVGGPLNVLLGNNTAEPLTGRNEDLTLGSPFAGNSVNYQNNLNNSTMSIASVGPVINQLSGVIQGTGAFSEVGGAGQLLLSNVNTFTGSVGTGQSDSYLKVGLGNNVSIGTVNSSLGLAGTGIASGSATASGWSIVNGGSGYAAGQSLVISSPNNSGGTTAIGTIGTVNASGGILTLTVSNGANAGNGYYQAPTVTVSGAGSGASIVPSNAGPWFTGNSDVGTIDLNGTATSEPLAFSNKTPPLGQVINSNTAASATMNGDISINAAANILFGGPGNIADNGDVYGNATDPYFKFGEGTLTLSGTNFEGGAGAGTTNLSFNLYGGSVILDYTTKNTNKISTTGTGALQLYNVNLQLNGSGSSPTIQNVNGSAGTKLLIAGNSIIVNANGAQNATLNLGPISRFSGSALTNGTVDFQTNNGLGGGIAAINTSTGNMSGVLTPTLIGGGSYTAAPAVTFSGGGASVQARGTAVWNPTTGAVTGIIINDPGSGYTSAPTIAFSTSFGIGASANGSYGSYNYLGGWATYGGGASFAATSNTNGSNTTITAVPTSGFGSVVAPGMLLDVGLGNDGGGATYNDATGTTFSASGVGAYPSSSNLEQTVGAIRFNSFSVAGSPNTLLLASQAGGNPSLFVGDADTNGIPSGDSAGGILDTPNTGNASGGAPSIISGGQIQFGTNGNFYIAQYNVNQPLIIASNINQFSSGADLIKTGPGELQMSGTVNSPITVAAGILTVSTTSAMGTSMGLGNGAILRYAPVQGSISGSGSYANTITLVGSATVDNESGTVLNLTNTGNDIAAGTAAGGAGSTTAPWDLTINGNAGGDITLSGSIELGPVYNVPFSAALKTTITPGFGQLIKNGANTLVLNGTDLISGGVTINNGTILLGNGTDTLPNNEPISINSASATLAIGGSNFDAVGPITLNGGSIAGNNTGYGNSGVGTIQAMAYNFNSGNVSANLAGIVGPYKATTGVVTLSGSNTYGGTTQITAGSLVAGSTTALSPLSAVIISSGGNLNVSGFANTIPSLVMASGSSLTLGAGNVLTDTGTATLAGTVDLLGTFTVGETLMTYTSETGTFSAIVPVGDVLSYGATALTITTVASSGPATLTWNNAGGVPTGDGVTWSASSTALNWNNGTNEVAYSDTSNSNISAGDIVNFTDANNGNYNVTVSGVVHPTSTTFNNSTGNYVVTGFNGSSGIAGPGSLTLLGTGSVTISSSNSYTGGTFVNAGSLVLASSNAFPVNSSLNVSSGASVVIANHSGGASYIPQMSSLTNSGTIDITNNGFLVHNGSIGTITQQVQNAYNNGGWNGNVAGGVITSSVAAADASHLSAVGVATGLSTFQGLSVATSDVEVKYTYYGDANLDGQVDGTDYSRIDNGLLMGLTGWYNGDFNYDGVVNGSDYTLIDNAFNSQGANIAAELAGPAAVATDQVSGGSSVPEPTSLGLLGIGAIGLLGRRNRRRTAQLAK